MCKQMGELERYNVEPKKSDTKEYLCIFYLKYKNS